MKKRWVVYMIQTQSGKIYTGITTDIKRRFGEHAGKKKGAKFFRTSAPQTVLFQEKHPNRSQASSRERQVKQMTRLQKLALIPRANQTRS